MDWYQKIMRSARPEIINDMKWKWNQCRDTSLVQWGCMAWRPVWLVERRGWRSSPWNLLTIPPSCFWKYFYSESENPLKQRDGSAVWVKISLLKPSNSFKSWWGRCLSSLIQWPEGNEPGVSLWEEPTRVQDRGTFIGVSSRLAAVARGLKIELPLRQVLTSFSS